MQPWEQPDFESSHSSTSIQECPFGDSWVPFRQLQTYEPYVFLQMSWQGPWPFLNKHSLMSAQVFPSGNNLKPSGQTHLKDPGRFTQFLSHPLVPSRHSLMSEDKDMTAWQLSAFFHLPTHFLLRITNPGKHLQMGLLFFMIQFCSHFALISGGHFFRWSNCEGVAFGLSSCEYASATYKTLNYDILVAVDDIFFNTMNDNCQNRRFSAMSIFTSPN